MNHKNNLKIALLCAVLCTFAFGACSRQPKEQGLDIAAAELVPAHYSNTDQNVSFDLTPEIPDGVDAAAIPKIEIGGLQYGDADAALAAFAADKTVGETSINPANQYRPEERSYRFKDESALNTGGSSTVFSTANGFYYTSLLSRLTEDFPQTALPFATPEDTIQAATDAVKASGYDSDISFHYITLSAEKAQTLEYHMAPDGSNDEDSYKDAWTEEDDAYVIYGTQMICGIPVYCEMYLLGKSMAQDNLYNAPVQAVYTARGLEWLYVMTQYQYTISNETVSLLPFQAAAQVVSDKLNSVLAPAPYEVYRAKLFYLVHLDAAQDYWADPIWYFEVHDPQDEDALVVLVDAVNGTEIPVG